MENIIWPIATWSTVVAAFEADKNILLMIELLSHHYLIFVFETFFNGHIVNNLFNELKVRLH